MLDDSLIRLINNILELHGGIERKWLDYLRKEKIQLVNFNATNVCEITENDKLKKYVYEYINFMNKISILMTACLDYTIIDRTRVKERLSVDQKIYSYCNRAERGRVIVHKCLNDLYGIRVVMEGSVDCNGLMLELKKKFPEKVRITNATKKEGYKGVHVYTPAAKGHFKWELQIWDRESYDNNILLHENHKRHYIANLKEAAQAEKGDV